MLPCGGGGSSAEVDPAIAVVGGNVILSAGTVVYLGLRRYLVVMVSIFCGIQAVFFTLKIHFI